MVFKICEVWKHELNKAQFELIREAQQDFGEERQLIIRGKDLPKKSELFKLSPFIDPGDPEKLIRLKGRLIRSTYLPYSTRAPIILPRDNSITTRIVEFYHSAQGHQDHQTVLNDLRRRFVINRARSLLNKIIRNCQFCALHRAKPKIPEMALLPPERISYGCRPFAYTGVDCFGPIYIHQETKRVKRWGLILTCLTTRGIQIQMMESMSGKDCVAALTIFYNQ